MFDLKKITCLFQIEELKEKERQLQAKDKQLADTSRKCTQLGTDIEKLQLDLQLAKKSDFSPSSSFSLTPIKKTIQTTDIEDESPSEGSSPRKVSASYVPMYVHI